MAEVEPDSNSEEESKRYRRDLIGKLPSLASGKKGSQSSSSSDSATSSLSDALTSLDSAVKSAGFGGTTVFSNILRATGKMEEIEQDEEGTFTVLLPPDHYFTGDTSTRVRPTGKPREREVATKDLENNLKELSEMVNMHVADGEPDLKEILEGRSAGHTDDSAPVVTLRTHWRNAEDPYVTNAVKLKAPRTPLKHYAPRSASLTGATGRASGFLQLDHLDRPIVEAELQSGDAYGYDEPVKYASAKVVAVEPFRNGHIVVMDQLLRRPEHDET